MSPLVITLALAAAVTHAAWNAFLRGGADRLWTITMMSLPPVIVLLPYVLMQPVPSQAVFGFITASALLQVAYCFLLVAAYRQGELGQIYPLVRGSVPLLVTVTGVAFRHEVPPPVQIVGVLLVGAGIASLALGRGHAPRRSLMWAFATSVLIASYASVDASGVALLGNGTLYAAWTLVLFGVFQLSAFLLWRGQFRIGLRSRETRQALIGGLVAMVSYGAVVTAYAFGAAGPIMALRETSVVFAVLLGWLFLGERLTRQRLLACLVVVGGMILISH